jgi:hypothetical protein
MNVAEFGQTIKQKYPQYANIDDAELGQKVLAKHPEYSDRVTVENPDATHGVIDAFKKGFQNAGDSIQKSGEELANTLETPTTTPGGDFAKFTKTATTLIKGVAQPLIAEPISTLFRAGGEVIQNATGYDINEATSKGIQDLVKAGMDTETAKKVSEGYNKYVASNPESKLAGSALGDIAEILTYALGAKGAKTVTGAAENAGRTAIDAGIAGAKGATETVSDLFKPAIEGAQNITKKVGMVTGKTEVALDDAVASVKDNLLSQIEGKMSSLRKLDKTRTDIIDTIAKNPNYHPEIDVENKAFNMTNQVKNMESDISTYSNELGNLFEKVDAVAGGIDGKSIVKNIENNIFTRKNMSKFAVSGGANSPFIKDVKNLLENVQKIYGDTIPRKDLWDIRKQIDNSINSISDTNVQKSLRQDLRKAFASSLETSLPGDSKNIVKRTMDELSKVIEARDYSRDVLNGFKIRGGKLTDIIRDSVGTNMGHTIGAVAGGMFGSIPGAAAGYAISKKIGSWLAENTLSNASERKALLDLVKKTPKVFDDMKTYIDGLPTQARDNAYKNIKSLPSPFNKWKSLK